MKNALQHLKMSGIRSFTEACADIEGAVMLTIGEPDFKTPDAIKKATCDALDQNITFYPPSTGFVDLRERIVEVESKRQCGPLSVQNILITNGATEALFLAQAAVLEPGDEVIMPTPCFTLYETQAALLGAKVIRYDTSPYGFQFEAESLRACINDKTKVVVLASPNNPTGLSYSKASMHLLATILQEYPRIMVILDEVYRDAIYEAIDDSIRWNPAISNQIIVTQSFSKSHSMTGWRIGYIVVPDALIHAVNIIHQNVVTGVTSFVQKGVMAAFDVDTSYMVEDYKRRRDYVYAALSEMGLYAPKPEGAFYLFIDIQKYGMDSLSFATRLAKEAKLVLIPGIYFGTEGYVRLSYCYDFEILKEGMKRLEAFIETL